MIPTLACTYIVSLWMAVASVWPGFYDPAIFAAQVEKETCITLKHKKCWNPNAELKSDREYGFGFGQFTIAYRQDGSVRFNTWANMRNKYKELNDWTWEKRFDPKLQFTAILLLDKEAWNRYSKIVPDEYQRTAFMLSEYNGGSAIKDIGLCRVTDGCDPTKWFGHVERTSLKSKVKIQIYGNRSPYDINREYVRLIMLEKVHKYRQFTPINKILEGEVTDVCL